MSAISFLAGLGAGAVRSERTEREMAIRDQEEARRKALFDMAMADRQKAQADEAELRTAAAPLPVTETPIAGPVEPGQAPLPSVPTVGAQQFASRGLAEAAANDPKAARERIISTLTKQGRVLEADKVKASGMQAEAAEMEMKRMVEAAIKEGTMNVLGMAMAGRSAQEIEAEYNKSGKVKMKPGSLVVEPIEVNHPALGKQRSARIRGTLEDGTPFQIDDALEAHFGLFSAADRFKIKLDLAKEARQAAKDDRMLDIQQQNADTNERYRRDQAENMRQQRALESERIAALTKGKTQGEPLQVSIKDMRDFQSDLREQSKDLFPVKEGADAKERAAIAAQSAAFEARAVSIFRDNAALGNPMVASTARQAIELAADKKNERIVDVGGRKFGAVIVNGQPVIVTGELQQKPQQAPTTPAPLAAARASPAQAPAAAPASPAALASTAMSAPQIPPQHAAALQPLTDAVAQAGAALAAAANSGDQRAIALYSQQVEAARAARMQEAVRRLGTYGAQAYLSSLPQ